MTGKISGAKKTLDKSKQVYIFAVGSKELYGFLEFQAPAEHLNLYKKSKKEWEKVYRMTKFGKRFLPLQSNI